MFVRRHGTGADPYVCFHGWSGDHRTFDPLLPFLPEQATLYAIDLPGCGGSPAPGQWTLDRIAVEVAAALDQLRRPFTLVGNCIGALVGMRAAMKRPAAVRRIVLIDAFAAWPWYFRVFTAPGWGRYAYASTFANPVGRWIANQSLAARRSKDSNLTEGFARVNHAAALRYLEVLREIRSVEEFSGLVAPVDIVFGAGSFRAVRESAEVWRRIWPWAKTFEVAGACHMPIREASLAVSEIVFRGDSCRP